MCAADCPGDPQDAVTGAGFPGEGYLTEIVFEQAGEIGELSLRCDEERERAERFDAALCGMQWVFAKLPHFEATAVPTTVVLAMLQDVVRHGQTGHGADWLEKAMGEMR